MYESVRKIFWCKSNTSNFSRYLIVGFATSFETTSQFHQFLSSFWLITFECVPCYIHLYSRLSPNNPYSSFPSMEIPNKWIWGIYHDGYWQLPYSPNNPNHFPYLLRKLPIYGSSKPYFNPPSPAIFLGRSLALDPLVACGKVWDLPAQGDGWEWS